MRLEWSESDLEGMVCPNSRTKLLLEPSGDSLSTWPTSQLGANRFVYPIRNGIACFLDESMFRHHELDSLNSYKKILSYYDDAIDWLFAATLTDESQLRQSLVQRLNMKSDSCVIDIGAGTGRDSVEILRRLGNSGKLFVQDLSIEMLEIAQERLETENSLSRYRLIQGSASNLPFSNDYFDALFSFGGLNEFGDSKEILREFYRVVKPGGKIVVGDEGVAPWLTGSEHHRILAANNAMFFSNALPIMSLPEGASDVIFSWVLSNSFYVFEFTVGDRNPSLDLDIEHKGRRGGSLRSRYFGQLEGVNPDLRSQVELAAMASGSSLKSWIEDALQTKLGEEREPS